MLSQKDGAFLIEPSKLSPQILHQFTLPTHLREYGYSVDPGDSHIDSHSLFQTDPDWQ